MVPVQDDVAVLVQHLDPRVPRRSSSNCFDEDRAAAGVERLDLSDRRRRPGSAVRKTRNGSASFDATASNPFTITIAMSACVGDASVSARSRRRRTARVGRERSQEHLVGRVVELRAVEESAERGGRVLPSSAAPASPGPRTARPARPSRPPIPDPTPRASPRRPARRPSRPRRAPGGCRLAATACTLVHDAVLELGRRARPEPARTRTSWRRGRAPPPPCDTRRTTRRCRSSACRRRRARRRAHVR